MVAAKEKIQVWFSVAQLAERFGVSEDVVYRLLNKKKLESRKIGGARKVHAEALAAYEAVGIPKERRSAAKFRTLPNIVGLRSAKLAPGRGR